MYICLDITCEDYTTFSEMAVGEGCAQLMERILHEKAKEIRWLSEPNL